MMVKEFCFHAQIGERCASFRSRRHSIQEERIWQLEAELERLKNMI